MLFFLSFLTLGIALGNSQQPKLSQVLGRMEKTMSTLNLRLARLEAQYTRNILTSSRLENNIMDARKDFNSKHGETMLWLKNTVVLLNDLKVRNERLEAAQNIISDNLQRMIKKTDECCQNETIIIVPCLNPTTVSSTKPVISSSTTTTVRPTTTAGTAPTRTSPTTTLTTTVPARKDCKSVDQGGYVKDGVYKLELAGKGSIEVFCSAGYVTIQRRFNGAVSFDRSFAEYEQGFGDVSGEHWLGLTYQHELTKSRSCSFRILLDIDSRTSANRNRYGCGDKRYTSDCDGQKKEILANNFQISSASDLYRVQLTRNSSDLTHANANFGMDQMNGQQFSCKDNGPEIWRAGVGAVSAGFWYASTGYPGYPNTVFTTTDTDRCSSSNQVCGQWFPYFFRTSWMQFRC